MLGWNSFTEPFAKALFDTFPFLQDYAIVDTGPGCSPGTLLVEYWPPPRREDLCLVISTHDEEITIGFSSWHAHYGWPIGSDPHFAGDPLDDLCGLIDDRVFVWDAIDGEKWLGSGTCEVGEDPDLSRIALTTEAEIRMSSFSGRHDRVIRADEIEGWTQ